MLPRPNVAPIAIQLSLSVCSLQLSNAKDVYPGIVAWIDLPARPCQSLVDLFVPAWRLKFTAVIDKRNITESVLSVSLHWPCVCQCAVCLRASFSARSSRFRNPVSKIRTKLFRTTLRTYTVLLCRQNHTYTVIHCNGQTVCSDWFANKHTTVLPHSTDEQTTFDALSALTPFCDCCGFSSVHGRNTTQIDYRQRHNKLTDIVYLSLCWPAKVRYVVCCTVVVLSRWTPSPNSSLSIESHSHTWSVCPRACIHNAQPSGQTTAWWLGGLCPAAPCQQATKQTSHASQPACALTGREYGGRVSRLAHAQSRSAGWLGWGLCQSHVITTLPLPSPSLSPLSLSLSLSLSLHHRFSISLHAAADVSLCCCVVVAFRITKTLTSATRLIRIDQSIFFCGVEPSQLPARPSVD